MDEEQVLRGLEENLSDLRFWGVYGDVLLSRDPDSPVARAIASELRGEPARPGGPLPDDRIEVEWWMGHWRAARVTSKVVDIRGMLSHPAARLLQHLVAPVEMFPVATPKPIGLAPRTLARLDLYGAASFPLDAGSLRDFRVVHSNLYLERADALQRLEVASLRLVQPLPALRHLALHGDLEASLPALTRECLPALEILALRRPAQPDLVAGILAGTLGSSLRRVEIAVQGPDEWIAALCDRYTTITFVVDGFGRDALASRAILRRSAGGSVYYLAFASPGTRLQLARAVDAACEAFGLLGPAELLSADWIGLPGNLAPLFARRMAADSGLPVHLLHLDYHRFEASFETRDAQRVEQIALQVDAIEIDPDGDQRPISLPLTRQELSYEAESDEDDLDEAEDYLSEQLWEGVEVEEISPLQPVGFRPDPYTLVTASPARAHLAQLSAEGSAFDLPREVGRYIVWRASLAGALARCEPPDLSRWTERLLRRYGIELPPEDGAHPYWADWRKMTRAERAMPPPEEGVASYKLRTPGRWILSSSERSCLAEALLVPIEHHTPPDGMNLRCRSLSLWLAQEVGEIEVLVVVP